MTHELAVIPPQELVRQSTDIAGLCKEIVVKCASVINGKKYVQVEGWQAIAVAHGCTASARNVEHVDGGVRAIGEVKRMSDGAVLSQAEGFVGDDEKKWADGKEYARRAMAQTRAISRACRSAFAHVVVLMDAGLSTTPAEEIPYDGFHDEQREHQAAGNRNAPIEATHVHFGKHKGKSVTELEPRTLAWFRRNHEEAVEGGKKRSGADTALYEAVKAEIEKRREASPTPQPEDENQDQIEMFNGPSHKALALRVVKEGIAVEDFLAAMIEAKQLPAHATNFAKMTEETAGKFTEDLDGTIEIAKGWVERKKAA